MAAMESIDAARSLMEDRMLECTELLRSYRDAVEQTAGEDKGVPPWLWTVERHVDALRVAAEAYMVAVHVHARPVLRDMARLSRPT